MKYRLPRTIYKRVIWAIKDYPRRKQQIEAVREASPAPPDGQPKGTATSDPTSSKAVRIAEISKEVDAIDKAKANIYPEYMSAIWNHLVYDLPYPDDVNIRTYTRWKSAFVYYCAVYLGLI